MIYQAIVETPSDLEVMSVDVDGNYTIGNDVVGELAYMEMEWPEYICPDGGTMMPGTQPVSGRKLNHVLLSIPYADALNLLEGLIAGYGLDWQVRSLSTRDEYLVTDEFDNPVLDTGGNVQFDVIVDMELDSSIEPFIADLPDGSRPVLPVDLHRYLGWPNLTVPAG